MPFERPTEYYDKKVLPIDEKICTLIKQRKEISNNNPGYPPLENIAEWANKYEFYEEFLRSLFGALLNEEHFRPFVEPHGFRKHVHILKSVEKDNRLYIVPFIRQYENASVVNLIMDWDVTDGASEEPPDHSFFELHLGEQYDCRMTGGGGSAGHYSFDFIVSPPLPDDISGLDLIFKEYSTPFRRKPTGLEIIMHLE